MTTKNCVTFSVTNKHFQLTAVALYSLIEHYNKNLPLDILIIVADVQQEDITYLDSLPKVLGKPQITVTMWSPPKIVEQINTEFMKYGNFLTSQAAWRLFFPGYFTSYEKMIYMDNDVLVLDDISLLFEQVDKENFFAAVKDSLFSTSKIYAKENYDGTELYGMKNMENYFNSGVLVFDVPSFNQYLPSQKILERINNAKPDLPLADQTLLNQWMSEHVKLLAPRYNYVNTPDWFQVERLQIDQGKAREFISEAEHVVIRHFAGTGLSSLSSPYQHVVVNSKWEAEFWRCFENVKKLSVNYGLEY